jgi:hypothetical protein
MGPNRNAKSFLEKFASLPDFMPSSGLIGPPGLPPDGGAPRGAQHGGKAYFSVTSTSLPRQAAGIMGES